MTEMHFSSILALYFEKVQVQIYVNVLSMTITTDDYLCLDTELYHPIIRKLGKIMEDMEEESGYLSNEQTKVSVSHLLPRILQSLNRYGECTILADARNIINLKIFPHLPDPPEVFDHEVPVAIKDLKALLRNCGKSSGTARPSTIGCW